jgi:enoyl-[acyl-carrier-protein] reductase (NADH)
VKGAGKAAVFLLSERSGFITGSTMFVEGAMYL